MYSSGNTDLLTAAVNTVQNAWEQSKTLSEAAGQVSSFNPREKMKDVQDTVKAFEAKGQQIKTSFDQLSESAEATADSVQNVRQALQELRESSAGLLDNLGEVRTEVTTVIAE